MNATDTEDRIRAGFAELLERLRADNDHNDKALQAKQAIKAREDALARVRDEYMELGIEPPSQYALSITAIKDLGYQMPFVPISEAAE